MRRSLRLAPWSLCVLLALSSAAVAQTWPTDFVTEELGSGWVQPTCLCYPDHDTDFDLLVAEKGGVVWNVRGGVKRFTPVIDLSLEVLNNGDRGLLGLAADPEWHDNGYIYLLYVVDPDGDGNDAEQESFGRLTRYTTTLDEYGDIVADPNSRLVLIGATWPEGIPSLHWSHAIGNLRFGTDGSLFVSSGDGAHYDLTDTGGFDPNGFGPGRFPPSEDIGSYRSLSLTSLAGKVLRIDPATGLGLPDNPYYTGNPADHASMVWVLGLRNPFRIALRPNTGTPGRLFISDVGWSDFEEINQAYGGENFGWPCMEGPQTQPSYDSADPYGSCDDPTIFTKPLWNFHHWRPGGPGFTGQCVAGAQVYEGSEYPQKYVGRLFFCEYASNWIRTVRFVNGKPTEVELFGNVVGNPIDLVANPVNGDLVYIGIGWNTVRRIRYTNVNHPPVVVATATPTWGPSPLSVTFDGSGSSDPEGQTLTYLWEFGDGTTDANPTVVHVYPNGIDYTAKLTVTDPGGEKGTWTTTISVDNTPPVIHSINSPVDGSFYVSGQTLTLDATASDAEDGSNVAAEWTVDLVHDHHEHPGWAKIPGLNAQWTAESHGPGTYFRIRLKVTDSRGLKTFKTISVYDLDSHAEPHLVSVSDESPRLGVPLTASAHLHYAGKGSARLAFDWGDGTSTTFQPEHMQERRPNHVYSAPGLYTLRVTGNDGDERHSVAQTILVRPKLPAVAIFTPLVSEHWMTSDEQWNVATQLANDLRARGFEVEIFGAADQTALESWLLAYVGDGLRDYLVCLDSAPSVVYAGQDDGSLAEAWLDDGNGVLWTGFDPFGHYILPDGTDEDAGAGPYAADEVLDAAVAQLCSGSAFMALEPDAADLPALAGFSTTRGLFTSRLNASWTVEKLYASDGSTPPMSDALVIRDGNGGEYAQFHCKSNPALPRADVLRDFFLTHLFAGQPVGPDPFRLQSPADGAIDVNWKSTRLNWQQSAGATTWLFEIAHDEEFTKPAHTEITTEPRIHLDHVLVHDRNYFWRVTARNDHGFVMTESFEFRTEGLRKPAR